jgi:hypothetical protein
LSLTIASIAATHLRVTLTVITVNGWLAKIIGIMSRVIVAVTSIVPLLEPHLGLVVI